MYQWERLPGLWIHFHKGSVLFRATRLPACPPALPSSGKQRLGEKGGHDRNLRLLEFLN